MFHDRQHHQRFEKYISATEISSIGIGVTRKTLKCVRKKRRGQR